MFHACLVKFRRVRFRPSKRKNNILSNKQFLYIREICVSQRRERTWCDHSHKSIERSKRGTFAMIRFLAAIGLFIVLPQESLQGWSKSVTTIAPPTTPRTISSPAAPTAIPTQALPTTTPLPAAPTTNPPSSNCARVATSQPLFRESLMLI